MKKTITLLAILFSLFATAQIDSLKVELDVVEKGYYVVYMDSVKISQHTKPLKAVSKMIELSIKYPNVKIFVSQPNIESKSVFEIYASTGNSDPTDDPVDDNEPDNPTEYKFVDDDMVSGLLKAFPTAMGAGAYNFDPNIDYTIKEVTNLNPSGPGSLWDAQTTDNCFVVLRVSGIVSMDENFHDDGQDTKNNHILGQTAPFPGITVVGRGFKYNEAENISIRYIKYRHWRGRKELHDPSSADVIDFLNSKNILLDHLSIAFGGDESISWRFDSHDNTMQNSFVSYGHAGGLFGDSDDYTLGYNFSSIYNVWHTQGKRTPNPNGNGRFDIIGNVVYNVLNLSMRTGGNIELNEIGNYYRYSPQSHFNFSQNPKVYTANNRREGVLTANNQDNTVLWRGRNGQRNPVASDFSAEMFPLMNFDAENLPDGDDAKLKVQNREMGANKYLDNNGRPVFHIDDLDAEAYSEWDNDKRFDWKDPSGLVSSNPNNRTQSNYRVIPQRQWLLDNEADFGKIVNTHSQETHVGVVPKSWILAKGLDVATFDPLGKDLDKNRPNILVYSFEVEKVKFKKE